MSMMILEDRQMSLPMNLPLADAPVLIENWIRLKLQPGLNWTSMKGVPCQQGAYIDQLTADRSKEHT